MESFNQKKNERKKLLLPQILESMAKKHDETEDQLAQVEEALTRTESFIEENQKLLGIIMGAIIVVVGGYYAYNLLYRAPLEEEAAAEMFVAEMYFEQDSLRLALEGNTQFYGFLEIMDRYSSTDAGKLAKYYAGVAYFEMGDYAEAIRQLDEFSTEDPHLATVTYGLIGDAFSELGQSEEALEYYNKAVSRSKSEFLSPVYLMKAGTEAEKLAMFEEALDSYKTIQEDFPEAQEANGIEKYIEKIEKLQAFSSN